MCWEFLIGMGIVLFQILLCIYLWWSFLFSQLIQWLGDFWLLKLHSWNKFHLVTMYYPFVCYWIQFSNFCKYFLYLCLWETLVCSFLVMSLVCVHFASWIYSNIFHKFGKIFGMLDKIFGLWRLVHKHFKGTLILSVKVSEITSAFSWQRTVSMCMCVCKKQKQYTTSPFE